MPFNDKVKNFLDDLQMSNETHFEIVLKIREIVLNVSPDLEDMIKYGGLVFLEGNLLICGIFSYREHLSIEFGRGVDLDDPKKLLEGNGKYRRHLKIYQMSDLEDKDVKGFVENVVKIFKK